MRFPPPSWLWPAVVNTVTGRYIPRDATSFVIVYLPRTGSNHLATLLDSHPAIICHHEVFNPEEIHRSLSYKHTNLNFGTVEQRDRDPWRFMHRVLSFNDGKAAVGFKLGPGGIYNLPLLTLLLSKRMRKIVLERHGWLHAYTSTLIARETKEWSKLAGSNGQPGRQRKVKVEPADFVTYVRKHRRYLALLRFLLRATGQPHMTIAYEDLGNALKIKEVLEFLGVDASTALTSRTVKQNSDLLQDRIENYDEVAAVLRGTDLSDLLDPDPHPGPAV